VRKVGLAIAAAAALLTSGALADRASALTLGNSTGILAATGAISMTEQIHCRPGRSHHEPTRFRRGDGCERERDRGYDERPVYRERRDPTVVVPGVGIHIGPGYGRY
jgi:hypothetical protein